MTHATTHSFAAFALLDAPKPLDLSALAEALKRRRPALAQGISAESAPAWHLRIGGGAVAVTPVAAPIAGLKLGPGAPAKLIRHQAHVVAATLSSSGDSRQDALMLSYVMAELCRQQGARGVYWPTSGAFAPADHFVEKTEAADSWPTDIWLRISVLAQPMREDPRRTGYGVRTQGLLPFFGYELDMPAWKESAGVDRAARRAAQVASYLFAKGGGVQDGDTLDFGEPAWRLRARLVRQGAAASLRLVPEARPAA
ncbi:hypothetical protein [Neomegalonema sp.]|uniref:hypothetical protein n=1 Tax=Neomegalonema sp. TaxID=2039713 RepID=UPI00261EE199|nr:hypothetical protein [Neomegalonema sp.]MDD2867917.1 hypothetical protein [Neomegalonema sp.]